MRKLLTLFTALLFVGSMWGVNGEIASSIAAGDQVILINNTETKELTGVSSNKGTATDYSNTPSGTLTLTVETGKSGTGTFSFRMPNGSYLAYTSTSTSSNNYLYTVTNPTTDDQKKQVSWTVSIANTNLATITNVYNDNRVLKYNSTNNQWRFCCYTSGQNLVKFFKVTVSSVATPTITPAEGSFQGSVEVTLACETDGATIYYTTDATKKDAPSTSTWTAYDGEDKPSYDATTTIYAAAIKDAEWSSVISKTFTLYPTEMTCAEAKTAALSVSANNELYADGLSFTVRGYVTDASSWDSENNRITFWMADAVNGGKVLQAYHAACENAEDAPAVGDIVDVTGQLTKYGSTPEFAAGATYTITKLPYVTPELTSWNFGDDIEQGTIGSDDTPHLLKTISLTGANLTADVRLDVVTTGGGDIFFLNGYKSYITLSPEEGEINYDICAIASTSTAGSFAGTITISSLKATPEFEPEVINLSITVLAPIAVTGVELDESAIELEVGKTQTLVATISPNNATNKAVTWESDDTEVATVDENGEVTAKKVGTATITCKSVADNTKSASCEVTVIPAPARITITQDSIDGFTNKYNWYTWTSGSVSGQVYAYKNSGIQLNPSKDGYAVYNTTAIPGKITKITMTKASGNTRTWNAYVSTSAMTEADAEGSTALTSQEVASTTNWDVTGTNAYFYLEVTDGATVIGSIVIEYEVVTPPTALDNTEVEGKAVKVLRNGILLIEKNGHTYNAMGQVVK